MKRLLPLLLALAWSPHAAAAALPFYIGTFTDNSASKGIYLGSFDSETGKLGRITLAAEARNPNFLALSPNRKFVYAVVTTTDDSAVDAFAVQPNGTLKLLNQQAVGVKGACHVSVDKTGRHVFVATYEGSSLACFPVKSDGSVGPRSAFIPLTGSGPSRTRQDKSYGHSIYPDETDKFVYACDLGSDNVWTFKFNPSQGTLTLINPPSAKVPPGSGPRHLAFHPNGKYAYVANEMGRSVTVMARHEGTGFLTPVETVPVLPKEADVPIPGVAFTTAEIACHPSGRWLYVSTRGCNILSVFKIADDGRLSLVQALPAQVKSPRHFTLDPTGRWLIAAGWQDNRLLVFKIDPATGQLTPTEETADIDAPVCLLFSGTSR